MKHTLSILLTNDIGALVRMTSLFAARRCHIDSITMTATHDPAISQVTLVLPASAMTLEQIVRHTRKLVDVISVQALTLVEGGSPLLAQDEQP